LEGVGVRLGSELEEICIAGMGEGVFDTERTVATREPAAVLRAAAGQVREGVVCASVGEGEKRFGEGSYRNRKIRIRALMRDDQAVGKVEYEP